MRILLAAFALALALTACGDDDNPISSGGASEKPESSPSATTETEAGPAAVCDLADANDVEAAYGEPVPDGSYGGGGHDVNGEQWQSDNCNWEVDNGIEVTLAVSRADQFADGELLCLELESFGTAATPVPELGDRAWWVVDEVDPDEGTLRICTDEEMIDIDMESPDGSRDPDTMRAQSVAFAEVVLANLG